MVQSDSLDLYVSLPDSTEWGIRKGWLGADLFMNEIIFAISAVFPIIRPPTVYIHL